MQAVSRIGNSSEKSPDTVYMIAGVSVAVLLIAAAVVIVIRKNKNRK